MQTQIYVLHTYHTYSQIIALLNACSEAFKEFPQNAYDSVIKAITSSPILACKWKNLATNGSNQALLSPIPLERQISFEYDSCHQETWRENKFPKVEDVCDESASEHQKSVSMYICVRLYICMHTRRVFECCQGCG